MPRFSDEWLRELLSKNPIQDVVGSYLPLKKKGATLWAKCPWHADSNPSFSVTPAKEMFYCFSCKKGGSVIQFVMEMEKLSYVEAVELLAARVGMEVPEATNDEDYRKRKEYEKRLYALTRQAARHFHENLKTPEGKTGYEYLKKRGITSQIAPFGLGYAMDSYDDMIKYLSAKGFKLKEIMDAGLCKKGDHGYYDTFRGRVMFPIINVTGEVIGFGGRIMDKGEPKYLNSPETMIFNKRRNLYALNSVKKKKDLKSILLVEGYMDVIGLANAGIDSAVASLGTSLTKEQARLLKRYTERVYLSYDGDEPGMNAAHKGVDILSQEGLEVYVIMLPGGQDPDEYVKQYGTKAFYEQAKKAVSGTAFKLLRIKKDYDLKDPDQAVKYCTKAAELIKGLDNEIEKDRFVRLLSKETGISAESISAQMGMTKREMYNIPEKEQKLSDAKTDAETEFIALMLEEPELCTVFEDVTESDFSNENFRRVFFETAEKIKKGNKVTGGEIISEFSLLQELGAITSAGGIKTGASREETAKALAVRMRVASLTRQKDRLIKSMESMETLERLKTLKTIDEITKNIRSYMGKKDF
ncbi:MAG: DNA primase [Christensenellaceae bacterium]|nr:DNA primase [Christensenellaceae bacterium]